MAGALLFYSAMALAAFGLARVRGVGLPLLGGSPGYSLAAGLGLGAAASLACFLGRELSFLRAMARELAGLLGPLRVPEVLAIALASGVGEEIFFRGALQPWIGLVPASILFALLHPPIRPGLEAWPWLALAAGLGMGLLARWSGGLLAPIGFHVALNAGNMAWIVSMEEACEPDTSSSPP